MCSHFSSIKFWDGGFGDISVSYLVGPKKLGRKPEFIIVNYGTMFNQATEQSPEYIGAQLLRKISQNLSHPKSYEEFDVQICVDVIVFGTSPDAENLYFELFNIVQGALSSTLCLSEGIVRRR